MSLIPARLTTISEAEATYALRESWRKLYGQYPSLDSLALLWSQCALETSRWRKIFCWNWANIKRSGDEDYCMYRCSEIINGKEEFFDPPNHQTWFRAYPDMLSGAFDYVKFLSQRKRYAGAWEAIKKGDPALFGHLLKVEGFYTASESIYVKNLVSLTKEFKNRSKELLAYLPDGELTLAPPEFPTIDTEYHPDQENVARNIVLTPDRLSIILSFLKKLLSA